MEILRWEQVEGQLPAPSRVKTYYPEIPVSEPVKNAALELGGSETVAIWGYGSSFAGDAKADSLLDLLMVVSDAENFHRNNISLRPRDYGRPRSVGFHTFLNSFGFNFYRTTLDTSEGSRQAKYGVIGYREFLKFARGGRKDSIDRKVGKGRLYVAGRLQKAMLVPIKLTSAIEGDRINDAINQSRIDGVFLAASLMPQQFSLDQLALEYVGLSYRADVRVEHPDKVRNIYEKGKDHYRAMLEPIIDQLRRTYVLHKESEDTFSKVLTLSERDVEAFLASCRSQAFLFELSKKSVNFWY
jgi:hypothetical protein